MAISLLRQVGSCRWMRAPGQISSNISRALRKVKSLFCVSPTKSQGDGEEIEARLEHIALFAKSDSQASVALWDEAGGIHRQAMRAILISLATSAYSIPKANRTAILQLLKMQSWLGTNQTKKLNLDECASLSLLLERLEAQLPKTVEKRSAKNVEDQPSKNLGVQPPETFSCVLPEVTHRLALLTKAAWAQQAREQAIVQLQQQHTPLDQPGSSSETQSGFSLGVTLGQPGLARVSPELALSYNGSLANDDAGYVMQSKEWDTTASVVGSLGVSKMLGASASASAGCSQSCYTAYPHARGYLQLNAHRLARDKRRPGDWSRMIGSGGFWRIRSGKDNELKDYQTLMRQAADQQPRLLQLLSSLHPADATTTPVLPGPILQQPGSGEVSTIKGQIGASVAATLGSQSQVGLSAGLNASVQAIQIKDKGWTPLWEQLQADAQLNRQDATSPGKIQEQQAAQQRANALDKKAISLCGANLHTHPLSRLWQTANQMQDNNNTGKSGVWKQDSVEAQFVRMLTSEMPLFEYLPPKILPKMLDCLSAEFDSYCATLQQIDAHGKNFSGAHAIERSLNDSWQGKTREQALANMIICHALLARATLPTAGLLGQQEKQQLDAQIQKLGDKLRTPRVKHDPKQLLQLSAHLKVQTLKIQETNYSINLNTSGLNLACNLALAVTLRKRVDCNPARAGEYIDLVLSADGSATIPSEALSNAISAALQSTGLATDLVAQLPQTISLRPGAGLSVLWRFFKPDYQQETNYPKQHRGFRLMTQRTQGSTSLSSGLKLAIPLHPGVSLSLGLSRTHNQASVLHETFGDNSLSMAMMLFFKLNNCEQANRWQQVCQQQQASLGRLFCNLANAKSAVHAEAAYLASILKGVDTDSLFNAMSAYAQQPDTATFADTLKVFNHFLQQLYPLYQANQADTLLIQSAKLNFDSWAWADQDERRANQQKRKEPGVARR